MTPQIDNVLWSLGHFYPDFPIAEQAVVTFLHQHGWSVDAYANNLTIRGPGSHRWKRPESDGPRLERPAPNFGFEVGWPDWHRDGVGGRTDILLGMWSNTNPTEIWYDKRIIIPEPFEFVVIDNLKVFHRAPIGDNRWFVRCGDIRRINP